MADYFKRIERKYGLTQEGFLRLLIAQESKCAICDRELVLFSSDRKETPCVDHNHVTGEVRSLLCVTCNVTVGYLEKDEYRTYSALAYLGNPQERYPGLVEEARGRRIGWAKKLAEDSQVNRDALSHVLGELEKLLTARPVSAKL